jgi:hypothetical protein
MESIAAIREGSGQFQSFQLFQPFQTPGETLNERFRANDWNHWNVWNDWNGI